MSVEWEGSGKEMCRGKNMIIIYHLNFHENKEKEKVYTNDNFLETKQSQINDLMRQLKSFQK